MTCKYRKKLAFFRSELCQDMIVRGFSLGARCLLSLKSAVDSQGPRFRWHALAVKGADRAQCPAALRVCLPGARRIRLSPGGSGE
jgi:hypothetical protein